jgi:hypothetical protein
MGDFGRITALEVRDRKRYPVEAANLPQRGVAPTPERDRLLSFPEVAAKASAERALDPEAAPPVSTVKAKPFTLWEKETFAFRDFIDILNPLQHIPIVATVYRNLTDDKIGAAPRVIGGALWGRIGGLVGGVVNAVMDWFTGKDLGDHVYAAFFGNPKEPASGTLVAHSADPSARPTFSRQTAVTAASAKSPQTAVAAQNSAAVLPAIPTAAQPRLNAYAPEKRWEHHDGDDRRVRFTA